MLPPDPHCPRGRCSTLVPCHPAQGHRCVTPDWARLCTLMPWLCSPCKTQRGCRSKHIKAGLCTGLKRHPDFNRTAHTTDHKIPPSHLPPPAWHPRASPSAAEAQTRQSWRTQGLSGTGSHLHSSGDGCAEFSPQPRDSPKAGNRPPSRAATCFPGTQQPHPPFPGTG